MMRHEDYGYALGELRDERSRELGGVGLCGDRPPDVLHNHVASVGSPQRHILT